MDEISPEKKTGEGNEKVEAGVEYPKPIEGFETDANPADPESGAVPAVGMRIVDCELENGEVGLAVLAQARGMPSADPGRG
jgi:hypothetical protein